MESVLLRFRQYFFSFLCLFMLNACGGGNGDKSIDYLELNLEALTLGYLQTHQVKVTATHTDGSKIEISDGIIFNSSNSSVATIANDGTITALAEGNVIITATYQDKTSSQSIDVQFDIIDGLIEFTPSPNLLIEGTNYQLGLNVKKEDTLQYEINDDIEWNTSEPSIATVSSNGLLMLKSAGIVKIKAVYKGESFEKTITVNEREITSVSLEITSSKVPLGQVSAFSVTALYNNGTVEPITEVANISSENGSVAVIDSTGNITSLTVGKSWITAEFEGFSASKEFEVVDAIPESLILNLKQNSVPAGVSVDYTVQYKLTNGDLINITDKRNFDIISSNESVATINDFAIQTVNQGMADITVSIDGMESSAELKVTDAVVNGIYLKIANAALPLGTSGILSCIATLSNGTEITVNADSLISENEDKLKIDNIGNITTKAIGEAKIVATYSGYETTINLNVTEAVLQNIEISFANQTLPAGRKTQATAIGTFTDGTTQNITNDVVWESKTSLVTVSNQIKGEVYVPVDSNVEINGEISALINASLNGINSSAYITVAPAALDELVIESSTVSVALGNSVQLKAIAIYSNGERVDVTASDTVWTSSNNLTVSNSGLVTSISEGDGSIRADFSNLSTSFSLSVKPAVINNILLQVESDAVYKGRNLNFKANASMSDNTSKDISQEGVWTVSDTNVATIDSDGLLFAVTAGSVSITFTPNDSFFAPLSKAVTIKAIAQMSSEISQSAGASVSSINGIIQNGSKFSLSITNNTGVNLNLLSFIASDANGVKSSTSDASLLSGGVLEDGEFIGLQYTVNFLGAKYPITLSYELQDLTTGDKVLINKVFN